MAVAVTIEDLRAFADDKRLEQLKDAQAHFNIFEAIGAAHKELWHSDFLAFLLNPAQNHGFGDEFTKRLLRHAIPGIPEIDSWADASVRREHKYIDILIEEEQHQISVIIENKIWSPEAPGQLEWYWKTITEEHSARSNQGWRPYGIFLTPKGFRPLEVADQERYHSLSYREVKDILSDLLEAKRGHLDADVEMTIRHYIDMLGRFIVGNADAEALARELYFKHRSAIKLMNPALWKGWIKSHLEHLIREADELRPEVSNMEYVRFRVGKWDEAEGLKAGTDKTNNNPGKPLLYFTFYNFEDFLTLYLWIGPSVLPQVRAKLIELSDQNIPPFCKSVKAGGQYYDIYHLEFLTKSDYQARTDEELKALIEALWQQFRETDLPAMIRTLEPSDWFWNAPGHDVQS